MSKCRVCNKQIKRKMFVQICQQCVDEIVDKREKEYFDKEYKQDPNLKYVHEWDDE